MSRVLPILFNTDMVRAILREQSPKTVTRRCIKGYIPKDAVWGYTAFTPKGYISCRGTFSDGYGENFFRLPCQKGDILYIRETFFKFKNNFYYKADRKHEELEKLGLKFKWHPSIHMPKEAARIWLKVKDVRVEKLQDITNEQIIKEGISKDTVVHYLSQFPEKEAWERAAHLIPFMELWNGTIKKQDICIYDWEANPWTWVIEFERCEKS